MACKKSRSHVLCLIPVGLGKGVGVLGKRRRCTGQKEEVYWAKGVGALGKRRRCTGQKEEVYWEKPRTMEKLEDRIQNAITTVPHDFLQKAVEAIPGRLRKLVDAAGAYTEF
jgi:hypothetical protein